MQAKLQDTEQLVNQQTNVIIEQIVKEQVELRMKNATAPIAEPIVL